MIEHRRHSDAHRVAISQLKQAAAAYITAFGTEKDGLENMAEDVCRFIAEEQYPSRWHGMVDFIIKAAG